MALSSLFIWIIFASGASGRPSGVEHASELVDSILHKLNGFIKTKSFDVINLPDVEDDQYFVKKFFSNGVLRDFSTITRLGNATINPQTTGSESINWVVETNVGLGSLAVEYDAHLQTFFGLINYNCHLIVQVKRNILDVETTVITNKKTGSCSLVLNDVAVVNLDEFNVSMSRKGFLMGILENVLRYLFYYVVPMLREGINYELHEFIRTYPMNPEITQYICEYFDPK